MYNMKQEEAGTCVKVERQETENVLHFDSIQYCISTIK